MALGVFYASFATFFTCFLAVLIEAGFFLGVDILSLMFCVAFLEDAFLTLAFNLVFLDDLGTTFVVFAGESFLFTVFFVLRICKIGLTLTNKKSAKNKRKKVFIRDLLGVGEK